MAPFDIPYTTFYWSAIVNIALSGTVFELFDGRTDILPQRSPRYACASRGKKIDKVGRKWFQVNKKYSESFKLPFAR